MVERGEDFHRWTLEQAERLRSGLHDDLDVATIADEIEGLGRSDQEALGRDLTIVLQFMLKWDLELAKWRFRPNEVSRRWELVIREYRRRVARRLKASPSLQTHLPRAIADAYEDARDRALQGIDAREEDFPRECAYSWADIVDRPYFLTDW